MYTKVQYLSTYLFKRQFNSTGANFATVRNAELEIRLHGKLELFHKDFLECRDIILFIENQHGFLVIDGFYTTERKRTISVRYQHRIGSESRYAFITIHKCLNVGKQDEY